MHTLTLLTAALLPSADIVVSPDFDTQIIPVLTKAGCNAGSCHGAASGRGGFRLSLWGSNPDADYESIVRELSGRRINLAKPERSLLLLKPTYEIDHGGDMRFTLASPSAKRIVAWVEAGARRPQRRKLVDVVVTPSETIAKKIDEVVELRVWATFDDKSKVDVTEWAVFTSTDPGAVSVEEDGKATVLRHGQHVLLVRYLDRVVPVRIVLPMDDVPVDLSKAPRHNWIDDEILATLATLRIPVSPPADDWTFVRRVYLDLTGTLPTPKQSRDFTANPREDKRSQLIDRLLASSEHVDYWTLKWGNLLRINSKSLGKEGALAFHSWVRSRVKANTPLDKMAKEMLLTLGDSSSQGPANFARIPSNPREHAEFVSVVFMGARMGCANCHNHPLDRWTQDDYHGLAAIFAKLERGRVVREKSFGEVTHPRTGEAASMRIPGERFLETEKDARAKLADWLTRPSNPYFARVAVNRLWKEMMGRAFVEPVDDLRVTNPATHPALLDKLADEFVRHEYDVRHIVRLIADSASYQRSSQTLPDNRTDDRFYSHALERPLEAEVLADAIARVTGVSDKYGEFPLGTRAVTLPDSLVPAPTLDLLGRCSRKDPCDEEARAGGLARTLHVINGPLLNKKIADPKGRLRKLLASKATNTDIVESLYLQALSRPLSERERAFWDKTVPANVSERERRELLEDFLWSLLTSKAFTTRQ